MKFLVIACIACITLTKAQLVKITGKWFSKVSVISEDGVAYKTIYTPIEQPQNQGITKHELIGKAKLGISNGQHDVNEQHKQKLRKTIKVPKSILLNQSKKANQRKIAGVSHLEPHQDDLQANEDDIKKQDEIFVGSETIRKINQQSASPQEFVPQIKPAPEKIVEQKAKMGQTQSGSNSIVSSSLRKVFPTFQDAESPFLGKKTVSDESGNLISHQSNIVWGKDNNVDGVFNDVVGNRNSIDNGNYNQVRGDRNVIQNGHNNLIRGDGSYVRGSGNIIY